uniref:Probable serine/threonine-protein kinase DDB_G0282963 n=1 Tax=Dermatophagoides pteronyssinus TaxID=6956 RepID=A0A6P6YAX9_DERPT|nr:probable serine/threonine-protein kinase DDB_G0282963 [Dermatophagoides pteronyssinus]
MDSLTSKKQRSKQQSGTYGQYTLPANSKSMIIQKDGHQTTNINPNSYHLILTPTLESLKTLSLPRKISQSGIKNHNHKNGISSSKTLKRQSKSFISSDDIPVVNPAFNDGTIMPTAISDYDDPLRLHHLPQQNPHPDLVEIRTNQKYSTTSKSVVADQQSSSTGNNNNSNNRSIPSFHLTKNVHSTLSKVTDPIEFCTLPQSSRQKSNMINDPQQQRQSINMSSFQLQQNQHPLPQPPTIQTMQTIQMNPRFSTSSSISNQSSSDVSANPSTTSSLFYVDYRPSSSSINNNNNNEQKQQHRNSSVSELSSNSSTITDGSSGDVDNNNHHHNDEIDDDLPPPPDILLCDGNDDIDGGGSISDQKQLTPTNKIAQLLPPLPPDYHTISTLQRQRKHQPTSTTQQFPFTSNTLNRSKPSAINHTINDVPAYSTTTLSSFTTLQHQTQSSSSTPGSQSSTLLRKPPPPPPPPRPPQSISSDTTSLQTSLSSSANSDSYADPQTLSIVSGSTSTSPITDNLTIMTTPSPTSEHYQNSASLQSQQQHPQQQQQQLGINQTSKLFNRRTQSPTYGWVYHQTNNSISDKNNLQSNMINQFEIKRCDSLSLAENGSISNGIIIHNSNGPNSLESGDSRQPLTNHLFDNNNNKNNKMNSKKKEKKNHHHQLNQQQSNKTSSNVYRNQVFIGENDCKSISKNNANNNDDDDDDGNADRTKERIIRQSYRMFFNDMTSDVDHQKNGRKNHMNGQQKFSIIDDNDERKRKFNNRNNNLLIPIKTQNENCCRRFCRSTIIILSIMILIIVSIILGITLYNHFVLDKQETGFSAIGQIEQFFQSLFKTNSSSLNNNNKNNNLTTTTTKPMHTTSSLLSTLTTTVGILMNTWNISSKHSISTTPSMIDIPASTTITPTVKFYPENLTATTTTTTTTTTVIPLTTKTIKTTTAIQDSDSNIIIIPTTTISPLIETTTTDKSSLLTEMTTKSFSNNENQTDTRTTMMTSMILDGNSENNVQIDVENSTTLINNDKPVTTTLPSIIDLIENNPLTTTTISISTVPTQTNETFPIEPVTISTVPTPTESMPNETFPIEPVTMKTTLTTEPPTATIIYDELDGFQVYTRNSSITESSDKSFIYETTVMTPLTEKSKKLNQTSGK